jgi:hypothetical protein
VKAFPACRGRSLAALPRAALRRPISVRASSDASARFSADDVQANEAINIAKSVPHRLLALMLAGTGAILLLKPVHALQMAYATKGTPLVILMIQVLGAIHLMGGFATNALANAASHGRLSSAIYKHLNSGLASWGTFSLATLYFSSLALTYSVRMVYLASLAAAVVLPVALGKVLHPSDNAKLSSYRSKEWQELAYMYGIAASIANMLALFVAFMFFFPGTSFAPIWLTAKAVSAKVPLGAAGITVLRLLGSGTLLVTAVFNVLQFGAERRRLGASTFKALNWGIAILTGNLIWFVMTGQELGLIDYKPLPVDSLADILRSMLPQWKEIISYQTFGLICSLFPACLYHAMFANLDLD